MKKKFPPAIVATCVVPWTEKYELDEPRFRRNVREQLAHLTKHLYVFGTAGEGYAVSDRQFDQIVSVFLDEMRKGGGVPMVGVISMSLPTIIERIERVRALGVRQFQISLPCWGELDDEEVDVFFAETCGRFPDCDFLQYNIPRTRRVLGPEHFAHISPRHPNLVAVKMGGGTGEDPEPLIKLVTAAPAIQFCFGAFAYAAVRDQYECAHLISVAATNTRRAHEFQDARGEKLRTMSRELHAVHDALIKATGDKRYIDGVYDKMLWRLMDRTFPLRMLPPYASGDEAMFERFRAAIPKNWLPDEAEVAE